MDRRTFIGTAGVAAGGLAASSLLAKGDHDHHHGSSKAKKRKWSKEEKALVKSLEHCLSAGRICTSHCLEEMAVGNKSMVACHESVLSTMAVVESLLTNISYGKAPKSALKSLAKTCAEFCEYCEKECLIHKNHHKECRECAESCADCRKACQNYIKAA